MTYADYLTNKNYVPNIVIYFKGFYWAIRQPDSGLVVDANRLCLDQVAINPTRVDPAKANTTINTYAFTLVDINSTVTSLFNGITKFFQGELVEIYVGRSSVGMDFSEYLKLPDTFIKNVSKDGNAYKFNSTEAKDRLNKPAFNTMIKLEVDIVGGTTDIDASGTIDTSIFPPSGLLKINDEFISYDSIDTVNNRFIDCIRGEYISVPAAHKGGDTIYLVTRVLENPIDILLQCLISEGGGGTYDVLNDGAGIDENIINVAKFEEIRDVFFDGQVYELFLYNISNILTYLENEILYPNELRIISDNTSKISLAILNRGLFNDDYNPFSNDNILKPPSYEVGDKDIINVINVEYDYDEPNKLYKKLITLEDANSIADFGKKEASVVKLKGVKETLGGAQIATDIAQRFLFRFSYPKPEIAFSTHIDKSLTLLGEKIDLETNTLPNVDTGELNFADRVEVLERGINWKTGDVRFKVGFTSFTGIRECYLAPSDKITSVVGQKVVNIGAGRGVLYKVGWKMRLYSESLRDYASAQVNTISAIVGDQISFEDDWSTPLTINHRIMFCDYDDAVGSQKKYCFISDNGLNFSDNRKSYQITL